MTWSFRRQLGVILILLTAFAGLPASTVLAANATVHGRLFTEGVAIPPGSIVRAIPEGGGPAIDVPVAKDNSFLLSQISEGTYSVEVIDPKGRILGTARAVIPAKASALDITVYGHPTGASAYIGAPPATTNSARLIPPAGAGGISTAVLVWSIVGGLVVGYFIGVEAEDDEDKCVSPSTPGCP